MSPLPQQQACECDQARPARSRRCRATTALGDITNRENNKGLSNKAPFTKAQQSPELESTLKEEPQVAEAPADEVAPSTLSQFFATQTDHPDNDQALLSTLSDLVDRVLKVQHAQSEKIRTRLSSSLEVSLQRRSAAQRCRELQWMVQTLSTMPFEATVLHSASLNIDRFWATPESARAGLSNDLVLLAVICTELKLHQHPWLDWQEFLVHIGGGKFALSDILRAERVILQALDFLTSDLIPSPLDFMRCLAVRLEGPFDAELVKRCKEMATYCLRVAMFDAQLEYRYPHAVLAAAALCAAMCQDGAPSSACDSILEDLASYVPGVAPLVWNCMNELVYFNIHFQIASQDISAS